jgi:hypothetical protein
MDSDRPRPRVTLFNFGDGLWCVIQHVGHRATFSNASKLMDEQGGQQRAVHRTLHIVLDGVTARVP